MVLGANEQPALTQVRTVNTFYYPDYTVDSGISPDHASETLVGYTTDRELEANFLTLPRRLSYSIFNSSIVVLLSFVNGKTRIFMKL